MRTTLACTTVALMFATVPVAAFAQQTGQAAACSQLELNLDIPPEDCGRFTTEELAAMKTEQENDDDD